MSQGHSLFDENLCLTQMLHTNNHVFFSSPAAILVRNSRVSTQDSNDTDQSSVPVSSKKFQMLLVCLLVHWKGSATLNAI